MKYRSEIDGLRAIAVLSVLIFHFFPNTMNFGFNGFLGVDIFFVISGFLISKYIYKNLSNNNFSFSEFYLRRVKRILPAALFTLIPTTVISIFVLVPYDLTAYFKSLIATLFFIPNFYFWRTGGYFGDLDSLKPLLHYWSLGIEEQFYLFFPIFIVLCFKLFGKNKIGYLILLLSTSSLLLNFYMLKIGGHNPSFFLLPTRIWEFGLGALAAYYNNKYQTNYSNIYSNILLILISLSFFAFYIPGVPIGIFVVFATAIYLFGNHSKSSISYRLLSNRISLFFGKISFSIYLIHWPVVVILNYIYVDDISYLVALSGLLFVVLASHFSYELIEKPFRYSFSNKSVIFSMLFIFLSLLTLSFVGIKTTWFNKTNSDLVQNVSNQIQTNYRCPVTSFRPFGASRSCNLKGQTNSNNVDLVIIGNSHAQMYSPIFMQSDKFENIMLVPLNGCLPTPNVNISTECANQAKINFDTLQKIEHDYSIVIAMTWYHESYLKGAEVQSKQSLLDDLLKMADQLKKNGNEVYVISPIPVPKFNHASNLSRKLKFQIINKEEYISLSRKEFSEFYAEIEIFDEALSNYSEINYINVYENLCDKKSCYFGDLNGSYFSDTNHLSKYGLEKVSPSFKKYF